MSVVEMIWNFLSLLILGAMIAGFIWLIGYLRNTRAAARETLGRGDQRR